MGYGVCGLGHLGAGTSSGRHRIRTALTETLMHIWILLFLLLCLLSVWLFLFFPSFICLFFAWAMCFVSLCHHRHRDYPHYEHVAWRWTLPAMPTGRPRQRHPPRPQSPNPPIPSHLPVRSIFNPLARHERGGNRLLQMPQTLRAKQIVTYKLCCEQTKPSNHPMNDWQALATIVGSWPQPLLPMRRSTKCNNCNKKRATTTTTTRSNKWFNNKLPPGSGSVSGFVSASRYLGICQVQA